MPALLIIFGIIILVFGGDFLVKSAVAISNRLRIPRIVIGLTVISFATSLPELLVSLKASFDGHPEIALNNVIGSNISNLGLILSIITILSTVVVEKKPFYLFSSYLILTSLLFFGFLVKDFQLASWEGGVLFSVLCLFIWSILRLKQPATDEEQATPKQSSIWLAFLHLTLGGVCLYFGAEFLVDGAVSLAKTLQISEALISVSIIAVGTSIPELVASVFAILKKEEGISIGNIIGSNIFNICSVAGLSGLIHPIYLNDPQVIYRDAVWMLAFSGLFLALIFLPKTWIISRYKGGILLALYGVFIYSIF